MRRKIEYLFAAGDCKGCAHYEEFYDCIAGVCEPIRHCMILETGKNYHDCKQLKQGEKDEKEKD